MFIRYVTARFKNSLDKQSQENTLALRHTQARNWTTLKSNKHTYQNKAILLLFYGSHTGQTCFSR